MDLRRRLTCSALLVPLFSAGCTQFDRWTNPPPPEATQVSLSPGEDPAPLEPEVAADMAGADHYYQQQDYSGSARLYARVADDERNPQWVAEKARFLQAESLYHGGDHSRAMETYHRLLQDFPSGQYRRQCAARMFGIADSWLDDTRQEIREYQEKLEGKRSVVLPAVFNFEKGKPLVDAEGHALKYLEAIHVNDITGPHADKALWLCGYVQFYRGNFDEADFYLSQLLEFHPDSELRAVALELGIMAKNNATGGPDYDGKKSAEALKLVRNARMTEPALANQKGEFLDRQMVAITRQQAAKDFRTAEFYERKGHPGSAYFYYELVRRRYPGDPLAEQATAAMERLRAEAGGNVPE